VLRQRLGLYRLTRPPAAVPPRAQVQCRALEEDVSEFRGRELLWYVDFCTDSSRFTDSEKWRAEYAGVGVEELVRTFDYKEKPQVFEYYPQYYHKTDKVR
jgi:hypothetical protein